MHYRVIRIAGHPVLATPARPLRLRLAGISRYQPSTPRRVLFRMGAYLAALTGLDRLIGQEQSSPISADAGFDFEAWLSEVRSALGAPDAVASVIWPPEATRNRLYVHVMTSAGEPIGFCKISLDATNDVYLSEEADTLGALGRLGLKRSETPRLMLQRSFGGRCYVVYAPMPRGSVPYAGEWTKLSGVVAEFGNGESRLTAQTLARLAWWQRFERMRGECTPAFLAAVDQAVAAGVRARRVHGDFTPANIMRTGAGFWLCDWEFSSPAGPYWTDRMAFYLARHHRDGLARPGAALEAMLRRLADEEGVTLTDAAMALAFLCGCGNQPARRLARQWQGRQELAAAD